MIRAILACDDEGGVSKDGTLPWPNNPTDLKWFKDNTVEGVVVMGSTTWIDPHMPRPLPKRVNVLATSKADAYKGAHEYIQGNLLEEIPKLQEVYPNRSIWIIGGPNIIGQTLDIIDEFYLSFIPGSYKCDTFLPLDKIYAQFTEMWREEHPQVTFKIYEKRTTTHAAIS
jgi:dihydrofolate reductase